MPMDAGLAQATYEPAAGFQIAFVDVSGSRHQEPLATGWAGRFEHGRPVRSFHSRQGRRNFPGLWWSATSGEHVGFESWLEREHVMLLDFDPAVVAFSSQPFWLLRHDGKRLRRHAPDFFARLVVVQAPVIGRIVRRGGDLIRMNRIAHYGRSGLMVSGPARTGKTTAVTQLGKTAEVMHRQQSPHSRDDIPVIYITVPPAATGKMIAMELARFLGLPVPRRANITDVIEPVCGICLDTRVTMIIVDELHNLDMSTRAGAEASDTLKYFSERLPATFVYAGIGLERGALLAGPRGDQVAGRFTLIPAAAFTPGQEWSALIAAIEGALRLYRHKDGTLVRLADYLHRRTRGMIGSLLWLIRDAACQAILDGTEKITRKGLDQITVDMTAQAPPPRAGTARR